jgi:hypothetical protein
LLARYFVWVVVKLKLATITDVSNVGPNPNKK